MLMIRLDALFILTLSLSSCIDFSMDPSEMQEEFSEASFQPESTTIEVDSNHMHYVHILNNRPNLVVFVHGSPGSWSAFADFMKSDTLLQYFDIISVDRPGYGLSDRGRPEPGLERQAYLLAQVLKAFHHQRIVLVGHSLGGPVIARLAMDYPELTQGLVLVAPSIDPEQEKYEWYRTWIDSKVGGWLTPIDFWVSNEEILPLRQELEEMLPLWDRISVPTIVIQGTNDMLVPKENAEFARRMINDSLVDIRYLEGANHFIPWSQPNAIEEALLDLAQ